ncbi:MAG TPA: methyl-accepting chemotaxis protein, partial [Bacteroidales bacterium]|nr:methyl-accepting chemotaxis protein [Bacteroidales bacterium]
MNFKDLKLGTKLGIGFGILILISAILGALAVLNMSRISVRANYLANEYVPEVNVSNDIERSSLQAMYQIRGYSFTEEETYLSATQQALQELQGKLSDAHDLAKNSTQLVKLNASVDQVDENVTRFENIIKELKQTNQNIATERTNMDAGAASLVSGCNTYLQSQNDAFDQEIAGGKTSSGLLQQRHDKISWINDILSQAHELRVANFKAQATRDSDALQQALDDFDISNDLSKIRAVTRKQADIIQLDNIEKAASTYLQAMKNYLAHYKKREALTKQMDDAGNKVNEKSVAIAEAGISNTEDIALGAVSLLKTSSTIMIVGLIIALLLGIIFAVVITRAITVPIGKGVVFAKEIAEGNLMAQIDVDQEDEVGQLSNALRNMANRLKEIVTNILSGAE